MTIWLELIRTHAALLLIAAPLIGAALAVAGAHARAAWGIGLLATAFAACVGIDLAWRGLRGVTPPNLAVLDIGLHADGVGLFAAPLLACVGVLVMIAAGALALRDMPARAASFGIALLLCLQAGWTGALLAADFGGVVLGAEIGWLSGVGIVALAADRDRGALTGALRMLVAGGVAGALLIAAAALIYRGADVIGFDALASAQISAPTIVGMGVALALLALCIMAGAAPLHVWLGAAFGRSGAFATLALGALGSVGALAMLARVAASAVTAPAIGDGVATALAVLGVAGALIGSFQAIGARNLRRLFAYAGAAQAGCVLLSLAIGSPAGIAAALVQIFAFAAAALALFGGVAGLSAAANLAALDGVGRRAPLAGAAITLGALSLMGAPLTAGFLSRWRLIEAVVNGGWWWAAAPAIIASLAGVFYGGRLIERLYFRRIAETAERQTMWTHAALAPALLVAMAAIVLGLAPAWLLMFAEHAARLMPGQAG